MSGTAEDSWGLSKASHSPLKEANGGTPLPSAPGPQQWMCTCAGERQEAGTISPILRPNAPHPSKDSTLFLQTHSSREGGSVTLKSSNLNLNQNSLLSRHLSVLLAMMRSLKKMSKKQTQGGDGASPIALVA